VFLFCSFARLLDSDTLPETAAGKFQDLGRIILQSSWFRKSSSCSSHLLGKPGCRRMGTAEAAKWDGYDAESQLLTIQQWSVNITPTGNLSNSSLITTTLSILPTWKLSNSSMSTTPQV
jgi:hypothetical protein